MGQPHSGRGQRAQNGKLVGSCRCNWALPRGCAAGHGVFMRGVGCMQAGIDPACLAQCVDTRCGAGLLGQAVRMHGPLRLSRFL